MKIIDKVDFLNKSHDTLNEVIDLLEHRPILELKELCKEKVAFIVVDMVNGFIRQGALKSPRVEVLIPEIAEVMHHCIKMDIPIIALADRHTSLSPEFDSYPKHCTEDSCESEIVDELKEIGGYKLISKNSTNGFLEQEFKIWLGENSKINTFIIAGDCTDICIQQLAITLKTWFNQKNEKSKIVVPINMVETYDLAMHNGDLMNVMSLYNMLSNGVEVVEKLQI